MRIKELNFLDLIICYNYSSKDKIIHDDYYSDQNDVYKYIFKV